MEAFEEFSEAMYNSAFGFSWMLSLKIKKVFLCKAVNFIFLPTIVLKNMFLLQGENRCWSIQMLTILTHINH